jgi:hypothetical protein
MRHGALTLLIAVPSITLGSVTGVAAQIRASERGTVSQTVDGTTITVDYGRPQTRGRSELFGVEVPWGKVWTPGANWATTLDVDRDIVIEGHPLTVGRYSVWLEVQPDGWTAILDPEPRRFHLMPPPVSARQVRFPISPTIRDRHVEVLTWSFPAVRASGTTLELAWGHTAAVFDLQVQPSRPVTVAADLASRYVGSYRLRLHPPLGSDTVAFELTHDGEHLVATWKAAPNPRLRETWLVSLGEGMFVPAEHEDGRVFDVVTDIVFEFTPLEGRATRFELRALGDELWGEAVRADAH